MQILQVELNTICGMAEDTSLGAGPFSWNGHQPTMATRQQFGHEGHGLLELLSFPDPRRGAAGLLFDDSFGAPESAAGASIKPIVEFVELVLSTQLEVPYTVELLLFESNIHWGV